METKTLRVKPSEADSCVQILSNFGWELTSKVMVLDNTIDLDNYTPLHYKTKYRKGKLALLTFERDNNRRDYQKLYECEKEYTSVRIDATKKPKSKALVTGLIMGIIGLVLTLTFVGLGILIGIGLGILFRSGAQNGASWITGIINWWNNNVDALASNQITGFLLNTILNVLGKTTADITVDTTTIDPTEIGKVVGRVTLLAVSGTTGVITIISNLLLLFIPGSFLVFIGIISLFVKTIKYGKASRHNRKVKEARAEVLKKLQE